MSFLLSLPEELRSSAYRSGVECAWPSAKALAVIKHVSNTGGAVCGVEVWLPTEPGPTIPTPFIYTWSVGEQRPSESWKSFARRANSAARSYIRHFCWDTEDQAHRGCTPYFNLDVVLSKSE